MKSGTEKYGDKYWCIKTSLSEDGEIYVMADQVKILPDGTIAFYHDRADGSQINLAISAGNWTSFYAASVIDGAAVAVEIWKNEVNR